MTGDTVIVSEVYSDEEDDAEFEREEERMGVYETDKIMTPSPRVSVEKILLPSPRVSVEEHELPIMVRLHHHFHQPIVAFFSLFHDHSMTTPSPPDHPTGARQHQL